MFNDLADELLSLILSFLPVKQAVANAQLTNQRVNQLMQSDQQLWRQYCVSAFPNTVINEPLNDEATNQMINPCPHYPPDWRARFYQSIKYQSITCVQTLADHRDEVLCIDVSHDGRYLISISRDRSGILYERIDRTTEQSENRVVQSSVSSTDEEKQSTHPSLDQSVNQTTDQSTTQSSDSQIVKSAERWVKRWQIQLPEGYWGIRCSFSADALFALFQCHCDANEDSIAVVVGTEHCKLIQATLNYPSDTICCWMNGLTDSAVVNTFSCTLVEHHELVTVNGFRLIHKAMNQQVNQSSRRRRLLADQSVRAVRRNDLRVFLPYQVNFMLSSNRKRSVDLPISYSMIHDRWLYEDAYQCGIKATRSEAAPVLIEPSQHPDWQCDEGLEWLIYQQSDREKDMIRIKRIQRVDTPQDEDEIESESDDDDNNQAASKRARTDNDDHEHCDDRTHNHSIIQSDNQTINQTNENCSHHDTVRDDMVDDHFSDEDTDDSDDEEGPFTQEVDVDQADGDDDMSEAERLQHAHPDDLTLVLHGRIAGMSIVNNDTELLVVVRPFATGAQHHAPLIDIDDTDPEADHAVSAAVVVHRFALNPFVRLSSVVHPTGFNDYARTPWQLPAIDENDVLALSDSTGSVILFDTKLHRQLHLFKAHSQLVNVVEWTDNMLLTASDDHTIGVWSVKS